MINIFTDGSCYAAHEKKLGGYGILFDYKPISKGFCYTTISRMEMMAIIQALRLIEKEDNYTLYSDSMYCVNTFNKWIDKWASESFLDRKNEDLLKDLYNEKQRLKVLKVKLKIVHVKGHQKSDTNFIIIGNNVVDHLADYKNFKYYNKDIRNGVQ